MGSAALGAGCGVRRVEGMACSHRSQVRQMRMADREPTVVAKPMGADIEVAGVVT